MISGLPDFNDSPFLVIWETTRSCALKCVHCRAEAIEERHPQELSTGEAFRLLDEIRAFGTPPPVSSRFSTGPIASQSPETGGGGKPLVVLTGGDPLRRQDVFGIVRHGSDLGLHVAVTPSGTPEVTKEKLERLKESGLARLAVSLDASSAGRHDAFRQVNGSFEWTLGIIRWARELGIAVQINTTVTRHNLDDLSALARLLVGLDICLWSVFFLVPTGRGRLEDAVNGYEHEKVFRWMARLERNCPFDIKSTEAPGYRRVLLEERIKSGRLAASGDGIGRPGMGINDGKGFVFISHRGDIYPSGFLPLRAGNVRTDSLIDVYRNAPLFRDLRDPSKLKGKCGACEYKSVCGGSRARAFGVYGDYLAPEPFCVHVPKGYPITEEEKRFWRSFN